MQKSQKQKKSPTTLWQIYRKAYRAPFGFLVIIKENATDFMK